MSLANKSLSLFNREIVLAFVRIGTGVVVARILGPVGFGLWVILDLLTNYSRVFGGFRFEISAVYFFGQKKYRREDIISLMNITAAALGLFVMTLLLTNYEILNTYLFKKHSLPYGIVALVLAHLPLLFLKRNYLYILLSSEDTKSYNRMLTVEDVTKALVGMTLLVVFQMGLWAIAIGMFTGAFFSLAYGLIRVHQKEKFRLSFKWVLFKEMSRYSSKIYVSEASGFLTIYLSNLIMAVSLSPTALAFFSMGKGKTEYLNRIIHSIGTILYPRISNLQGMQQDPAKTMTLAFRISLIVLTAIGLIMSFGIYPATLILYGSEFTPMIYPFFIIIPGMVLYGTTSLLGPFFLGIGRAEITMKISLVSLILQGGLCYLLMPSYGLIGGAAAVSISFLLSSLITVVVYGRIAKTSLVELFLPKKSDFLLLINLLKEKARGMILKKRLRRLKMLLVRMVRILRYGDAEAVSFFDAGSPECLKENRATGRGVKIRFALREMVRSFTRSFVLFMREDRSLLPDLPLMKSKTLQGKYLIGLNFKNAFCLARDPSGEINLPEKGEPMEGIYFFLGRQLAGTDSGLLELYLESPTQKIKVLSKKVLSLPHNWDAYFIEIPSELQKKGGPIKLAWNITRPRNRVFLSTPVIKRTSQESTCLVLILDAVRPGDLGVYGNGSASPNIDRFFSSGAVFENSFSQSNWTLPTFASMALSRYASDHHVVDPDRYSRSMDRSIPTLAELLRSHGFYTYGSVSHRRCNHSLGHHRGFEHFSFGQTLAGQTLAPGKKGDNDLYLQLRELCDYLRNIRGVPFFGFVHFFDTHFPYLHHPGKLNRHHLLFQDSLNDTVWKSLLGKLDPEKHDYLFQSYLDKLRQLDEQLAELFRMLEMREKTTVILTSDHGYSFAHPLANDLSDEEIRTPFLVKSNEFQLNNQGAFVESSIDLFPTITSLYGIEDKTRRSGSPLFDPNRSPKNHAISEIVYLDDYRLRILGKGYSAFFGTRRNRSSFKIDLAGMEMTDFQMGTLPFEEFKRRLKEDLHQSKIQESLKKRLLDLELEQKLEVIAGGSAA